MQIRKKTISLIFWLQWSTSHFREPLDVVCANLASIQDEVEEVIDYARKYLSIQSESYLKIWHPADATKWPNVLVLAELLFC